MKRIRLFLAMAFTLGAHVPNVEAQYVCNQPTCLSLGGPVKPVSASSGWIVGEIKMLAFGEDSKAQIMTDLMAQGWVECAGQPLPRTAPFDRLFTEMGDTWGSGDGKTDYYLPDLRGVFVRGWNHDKAAQMSPKAPAAEKAVELPVGGDPDAALRQAPRPEIVPPGTQGASGDNVASEQQYAERDHLHQDPGHSHSLGPFGSKVLGYNGYGNTYTLSNTPGQQSSTLPSPSNLGSPVAPDGTVIPMSEFETRPKNAYVMWIIYLGVPVKLDANGKITPK
jgi:hypothetical protein